MTKKKHPRAVNSTDTNVSVPNESQTPIPDVDISSPDVTRLPIEQDIELGPEYDILLNRLLSYLQQIDMRFYPAEVQRLRTQTRDLVLPILEEIAATLTKAGVSYEEPWPNELVSKLPLAFRPPNSILGVEYAPPRVFMQYENILLRDITVHPSVLSDPNFWWQHPTNVAVIMLAEAFKTFDKMIDVTEPKAQFPQF